MTAAREIEQRAAQWIVRREDPDWSIDDQRQLDSWLAASMAHKAAYWRLDHGWRAADRIAALGPAPIDRGSRTGLYGIRRWLPATLAASLLAAIGLAGLSFLPRPAPVATQSSYRTPIGGHRTVPLADGSRVEMNTDTEMRTTMLADKRQVWLDHGEAYFDVVHMENRPFVIHAGSKTITVLGTRFAVRRDGNRVTVAVVSGRVRVTDGGREADRSAVIDAGDIAIAQGGATLLTPRSTDRVEEALAWRSGMLTFDQVTLAEAAAEFNRYNVKPIVITDPETANIRIGGSFEASNVGAFLRLLHQAYGLRVVEDANGVKISS